LQQLHVLGPNSVGVFATNNSTGALAAQSDLALLTGATLDRIRLANTLVVRRENSS
jgi:hypothetical protein